MAKQGIFDRAFARLLQGERGATRRDLTFAFADMGQPVDGRRLLDGKIGGEPDKATMIMRLTTFRSSKNCNGSISCRSVLQLAGW
jgi:hypothetical protein